MAFDFAWKSYSSKPVREKVEKRNKDGSIKYNKDGSIQYGTRINAGALAQNIAGNGMMMGYGLLSQIPEKPDAENTNNTVAKDVRSHINDAMMQSGNPYLMGAAFLDQGLNKLGWGATATNAKELGTLSNVGNTALASTPIVGAVAGKLFGTSTAQKYKSDLLEGSKMFNWQSDADGLFGAKGVVFNGNKAKKLVDDKNMKLNLADSILHDAKRDFTTDIGMIAQRINMDLTGGQDRVTNFGPAAAKQGAVLQFSKRTLSKNKIKKQQNGGIVVSYKPEGDIEINLDRTPTFEEWIKQVPKEYQSELYDLKAYYEEAVKQADFGNPELLNQLNAWLFAITRPTKEERDFYGDMQIPNEQGELYNPYHLGSIIPLYDEDGNETGEYMFVKLGTEENNPELHWETDEYKSGRNGLKDTHDLVFEGDRYYYRLKNPEKFKEGGKVNVIPEGALHKNKHHLEEIDEKFEDVTTKGIPVIVESEDGEVIQQAEVEREEIIFRLEVTKKLEELSKKHTDEAAIEAGKLLVKEILYNTEDNTGKMI